MTSWRSARTPCAEANPKASSPSRPSTSTATTSSIRSSGFITVTTLYLDRDYVVDQVFWQHAALLADRLDAQDFADELYSEPAQILHLGEARAGMLMPWLDELVALSLNGPSPDRFYRMQALLFALLDVVTPHVRTSPVRRSPTQRRTAHPSPPRHREFAPVRTEAREAVEILRRDPAKRWTLATLASTVHLSASQLGRVFVDAYGKTPMTYLVPPVAGDRHAHRGSDARGRLA